MKEDKSVPSVGESFGRLIQIAATLRGEHGCVWDKEQTYVSLKPFLLEESYEVLAAIDEENSDHLREELGDLLYQVIFLAQISAEEKKFNIGGVIEDICAKLIRRHPHVFGEEKVVDSREVLARWEEIKKAEGKKDKKSVLDGVPTQLPGLLKAHRIQEKAARVGFDWDDVEQVFAKIQEEIKEFESAFLKKDFQEMEDELGDVLFSLVNMARFIQVDPEKALNRAIARFVSRFHFIEEVVRERGKDLMKMSIQEMDELWEEAKKNKV